jgi:hypothetical protein
MRLRSSEGWNEKSKPVTQQRLQSLRRADLAAFQAA